MSAEVLALVPARGGSKGIPRKNVRPLAGRPLITWTLEHARRAQRVSRVVVTTDDDEIERVSRAAGAEVIRRPKALSSDTATSESALEHALAALREAEGYEPDLVVFLQCTSPLRQPGDIDAAIATLRQQKADALFSCCAAHGFLWRRHPGGEVEALNYDPRARPRRQEAPTDLVENGSMYVFSPRVLARYKSRLGGRIATYTMSVADSLQVDEPDDFALIEGMLRHRRQRPLTHLWSGIRHVFLDFRGVLTDNRMGFTEDGGELLWLHRDDARGIEALRRAGVEVKVLREVSDSMAQRRGRELGVVDVPCARHDRVAALEAAMPDARSAAFVGHSADDLALMSQVGVPVAVHDAHPHVLAAALHTTERGAGEGVLGEVARSIAEARAWGEDRDGLA